MFGLFNKPKKDELGNVINDSENIKIENEGINDLWLNTNPENASFKMVIEDVSEIDGHANVMGKIEVGEIKEGERIIIICSNGERLVSTTRVVMYLRDATEGMASDDIVGITLEDAYQTKINAGDIIIKP